MNRLLLPFAALVCAACPTIALAESSWIFQPSTYTHSPATGERVAQFAPTKPAWKLEDPTYEQSAYRHSRSSLQIDGTYDNLHVVETWGRGEFIRPYGEWEFPFREGATPYGPWGNPNGPWTTPFGAWVNPYGLGRLPSPWMPWPALPVAPTLPSPVPLQ